MSSSIHDSLLALLDVARENPDQQQKLQSILDLEPTRRKMAVNILVTTMRKDGAPEEFLEAWDALQNDALAEGIKSQLERQGPSARSQLLGTAAVVCLLALSGFLLFFLLAR